MAETIDLNNMDDMGGSSMSIPGLDLFMNEKKISRSNSKTFEKTDDSDIKLDELDELDDLEADLDNMTTTVKKNNVMEENIKIHTNDIGSNNISEEPIKLGINNLSSIPKTNESTWDGFSKFNDIPVEPEKAPEKVMTKEEKLRKKFEILRKLEAIEKKGIKLSKNYNMESSLMEMEGEYEMLKNEREKSNSVKFQGKVMMAMITGLEFLNNRFDPFDLKLDGWAESVQENLDDYDEIFGELHEKYSSKASMSPELKLLFQLGGSAVMLHMTNTMFKSALPGMDEIMRQNPELAQQFTNAAVNSMSQQNPGFGNFMNSMMNQSPSQGVNQYNNMKQQRDEFIPPVSDERATGASSHSNFANFNDSVNMDDNYASASAPMKSSRMTSSKPSEVQQKRPEMKGPSNIDSILSRLKPRDEIKMPNANDAISQALDFNDNFEDTKVVEMEPQPVSQPKSRKNTGKSSRSKNRGGGSTISIEELELMSKDTDNFPKRTSRRKPKSERNTVNLNF